MDASANTASSGIGVIFCRIELAVPLVVDELIVACVCDHGVGHTFSGRLAGEEIVQPGQNLLRESDVVRLCFGQRRGFCDIQNHTANHCYGSHCPT